MGTSFPKPEIAREKALQMWMSSRSDYAKEQLALNSIGLIRYAMSSLNLPKYDNDLFQTGVLGLLEAIENFRPQSDADSNIEQIWCAYSFKYIKYKILLFVYKERAEPTISLDELVETDDGERVPLGELISDGKDYENLIVINMDALRALDNLPEPERKKLCLKMHIAGYGQKQIARVTGVPDRTIRYTIAKVKKHVKIRRKDQNTGKDNIADMADGCDDAASGFS